MKPQVQPDTFAANPAPACAGALKLKCAIVPLVPFVPLRMYVCEVNP